MAVNSNNEVDLAEDRRLGQARMPSVTVLFDCRDIISGDVTTESRVTERLP